MADILANAGHWRPFIDSTLLVRYSEKLVRKRFDHKLSQFSNFESPDRPHLLVDDRGTDVTQIRGGHYDAQ